LFYLLLGALIFVLDHVYGTVIYAEDETTFYHVFFQGTTYWITKAGLTIGGLFVGLGLLYLLNEILKGIHRLLNRTVRISVVVFK